MNHTVDMHELRVGMFVHLDLGWMSHPFPLSSFRITSEDQIATIRGLGLKSVRWVPEKSELVPPPVSAAADDGRAPTAAPASAEGADAAPVAIETLAERPELIAARERRTLLASQRAAATVVEKQHAEAGRAWREAQDLVRVRPEQARRDTESLTRALLDKMLIDGELCVRLLSTQAGDHASLHALNVAVISMLMGRTFGLGVDEMMDLGVGALLHDVGKLDVVDRLRHEDDRLTTVERNHYREHVSLGVSQGKRMALSPGALLVLAQHHESADGSGFPLRLSQDRMSMAARIVSIVNRYDNLCNPPLVARALTPHEALSTLFSQHRSKFDGTVLNAFIRMMGVYPAGSLVQLTDDRHAMVVGVNSSRPLKPRVLIHDPDVPRDEALVINLEELPDLGIRRSLGPSKLPAPALDYLAPRPRVCYFFEPLATQGERAREEALA
jgi:HD-GYP domain-containing protein (c-di-GMP phosphodiesterase class II)